MKLKELLDNNPISFLDEDNTFIGNQPLENQEVSFDSAYSRPIGTYNGLEIWGSKYFGKNYDLYGILDKQRNILSWCLFDIVKNLGYSTLLRVFVDKNNRGKNLTLLIINFLTEKGKEKIMVDKDEFTSDSSRGMLKAWYKNNTSRRFEMNFIDNNIKIETPDIESIFKIGSKNKISITMESISDFDLPRYGSGKRIVKDWIW